MKKHPILIIGATSGIGRELAQQYIAAGQPIITMSRTANDHGPAPTAYTVDFSDPDAELPKIEAPLSGLVYCPGSINLKPFPSLKDTNFRDDFELNVMGAVRALRAYFKNLKSAGDASVVLVSTVAVGTGMPYHASIAASKGAVQGLAGSLAAEWAPHVRVNVVAPALTDTPLAAQLLRNDRLREGAAARHPLKRIGAPADVANAIAFLLSDQSSWATGQILGIDGGMSTILAK